MAASSPAPPPPPRQLAPDADGPGPPRLCKQAPLSPPGCTQGRRSRGAGTCPKGRTALQRNQPLSAPWTVPGGTGSGSARAGGSRGEGRGRVRGPGPPPQVRTWTVGQEPGVGSEKLDPQGDPGWQEVCGVPEPLGAGDGASGKNGGGGAWRPGRGAGAAGGFCLETATGGGRKRGFRVFLN